MDLDWILSCELKLQNARKIGEEYTLEEIMTVAKDNPRKFHEGDIVPHKGDNEVLLLLGGVWHKSDRESDSMFPTLQTNKNIDYSPLPSPFGLKKIYKSND